MPRHCFHCALPASQSYSIRVLGEERLLCCRGCPAVAEAIVSADLEDCYRYRTAPADGPRQRRAA